MKHTALSMPPIDLRRKFYSYRKEDSPFAANARLLQSIWRRDRLGKGVLGNDSNGKKCGNLIPASIAAEKQTNFLTERIAGIVADWVETAGSNVRVDLLSSQALTLNLFGELAANQKLATELFTILFPEKIAEILSVEFGFLHREDLQPSAFDVHIAYQTPAGTTGFIGMIVHYAEKFDTGFPPNIFGKIQTGYLPSYDEAFYIVVHPEKNAEYQSAIPNPLDKWHAITLEKIIQILKVLDNSRWIRDFEDRYLRFEKIELERVINRRELELEAIRLREKTLNQSLDFIKKAIEKDPSDPFAYYWQAETLLILNRNEEAVKAIDQAISLFEKEKGINEHHLLYFHVEKLKGLLNLKKVTEYSGTIQNILSLIGTKDAMALKVCLEAGGHFLEHSMQEEAFRLAQQLRRWKDSEEVEEFIEKVIIPVSLPEMADGEMEWV